MISVIREIDLDVAKLNYLDAIITKQYDRETRFLKVSLQNSGVPVLVENTASVTINARRPDGVSKSFLGTVNDDGTVSLPITYWMVLLDGKVTCDVSVIQGTGLLTTCLFELQVQEAANANEDISDDEDYGLLVSLIKETQAIVEEEKRRVEAEKGRVSAEETRVTAENSRSEAETKRADAETKRVQQEKSRVEAEAGRVEAEKQRVSAERDRADAEQGRVSAENLRVSAENDRSVAETERQSNEATRKENETTRVEQENSRQTAEKAREQAETARAASEDNRIASENERVSAETTRQKEHQKAVDECYDAANKVLMAQAPFTIADMDNNINYKVSIQVRGGKPVLAYTEQVSQEE